RSPQQPLRVAVIDALRLEAAAAHESVSELLAELDARLIERIDVVEHACVDGGDLEHHEELADGVRIDTRQLDRHVHASAAREGSGGRLALRIEQLAERASAQVRQLIDVAVHLGYGQVDARLPHTEEC